MANVMITGASSGLGAAIARLFAGRGDSLYLVARRKTLLEELQKELLANGAPNVEYRVVDLEDEAQVQQLADDLPSLNIDVLINNAAFGQWNYIWDTTAENVRSMIALNVSAVAVLSSAFSKIKHEHEATLMNVASGAGYALFEAATCYTASKFFVTALTEGIALELASKELPMRAQLLAPGPIATEFALRSMEGSKMPAMDASGIQFHTAEQVAEFALQLYDSNSVVGAVQDDMSFLLSDGLHPVGKLPEA